MSDHSDEPSPLTAAALTAAMHGAGALPTDAQVTELTLQPVGTGQMADTFRVAAQYRPPEAGPATLIAKLPAADEESASAARTNGSYERECRFYTEIAPTLSVPLPRFLGIVDVDGQPQGLLLEDLAESTQGDQVAGASDDQLALARRSLVGLQVAHWDDRDLGGQRWLTQWTGRPMPAMQEWFAKAWTLVEDRIGAGLSTAQRDVVTRLGHTLSDWAAAAPEPFTLVHLDYRLDNFLFADDRIWIVDWQTVGWGSPGWDLAYLIGTSVEPEHRRAVERDLVNQHADDLATVGITGWDGGRAWAEYRRMSFSGVLMAVAASGRVGATPRGDRMFGAMLQRHTAQVLDLDALEFLP